MRREWGLLLVVALFAALVVVMPLLRAWRQTGSLPFVLHREQLSARAPLAQLTALALGGLLVGGFAYAVAYGALGAETFGGRPPQGPLLGVGLAVMAAGTAIIAVAQAQMGRSWRIGIDPRPTEIVDRGLYARIRHPIYSGLLLWLVGLVLFAPSPALMLGAVLALATVSLQARLEEQHLLAMHGEAYAQRARQIGRFLPGIGKDLDPVPPALWLGLTAALLSVAVLDLLQVIWLPWKPKHTGALMGALLYGSLALGAWKRRRWAAIVPMVVPLLPVSILLLSALGLSVGVPPDGPMVFILLFQLAAAGLGAALLATER